MSKKGSLDSRDRCAIRWAERYKMYLLFERAKTGRKATVYDKLTGQCVGTYWLDTYTMSLPSGNNYVEPVFREAFKKLREAIK